MTNNPQAFNQYKQFRQSNGNPMELFKQMTGNYTPEQMQGYIKFAKSFGVPDELLQQIQNLK